MREAMRMILGEYEHPVERLRLEPLPADRAASLRRWLADRADNGPQTNITADTAVHPPTEAAPPLQRPCLFTIHPRPAFGPAGYIVCQTYPNGQRGPVGVAATLDAARTIIPPLHMAHPAGNNELFIVNACAGYGTMTLHFDCPADRALFISNIVLTDHRHD